MFSRFGWHSGQDSQLWRLGTATLRFRVWGRVVQTHTRKRNGAQSRIALGAVPRTSMVLLPLCLRFLELSNQ